jgi:arylsulfatase A-like enzyme
MKATRLPHLSILALTALSLAACPGPARDRASDALPSRPNVLFIAVDDLRPELGAYGRWEIHSPHIDRLAREGLLFERAYVQQAVCSPSRTSLLTGLRPDATRVWDLRTHFRDTVPDVVTLPQYFKENGYHTEWYGKIYHAGLLDEPSWSRQGQRFEPEGNWRAYVTEEASALADANEGAGPPFERADVPDDAYPDGKIADAAVAALQRLSEGGEPFFLAVGFYKPHLPFNAPERYWELYDPEAIEVPELDHAPDGTPEIALTEWHELRNYAGIPRDGDLDERLARQLIHGYRASVSYTDAQIGKVLDGLDRLGLRRSTVVVLWGDHGWKLGEYGDWCKHTNFELDTRAPLVVSAPGMKARGQATRALVELVDLYPTLVELAGLPGPDHLQGTSFAPLLEDPGQPWKEAALSQYPRGTSMGRSMRTDRFRFTLWRDEGGEVVARELYDHEASDPLEVRNLADDPAHAQTVTELEALLEARWRESLR